MPTISHKNLPNNQLHECKGASSATAGQAVIATGTGTALFKTIMPHAEVNFVDVTTPATWTYSATYAKIAPTTVGSGFPVDWEEHTNAKLLYTSLDSMTVRLVANLSVSQATGADRDIEFAIYKNGVVLPKSKTIVTLESGKKTNVTIMASDTTLMQSDYFEVYAKNNGASGDLSIYNFHLQGLGMRM